MTQESMQKPSDKSVSIGTLLVNARNEVALSQIDVAEQINLPLSTIQALETDDFDNLPENTYVCGYLRNYARVVGVNPDLLVNTFKEQHYQEPEFIAPTRSKQSYDPAIIWSTAAVLTILVGLVITWWFESAPNNAPEVVLASVEESVVNESSTNVDNEMASVIKTSTDMRESDVVTETSAAELDDEVQITSNPAEIITSDQQQAMEDELRNPNLVSLNDGAQMLTVTYVEKSWTEIRDADANTLMQGLIEPGVVRNLSGKPPFEVFLGNSPGVVIEVNGHYFDHSRYNRSNRTARFQVSSSSLN